MKAAVRITCVALVMGALGIAAGAQQSLSGSREKAPLTMNQVDRAHMPAADRALLDRAQARLARAAMIFGYRIEEPGWACDEVLTPDMPDYLMMVCRQAKTSARGPSAFSAMIARKGDAVYVVPVLYGGAAPWKTAANMKASREIFNHVVPSRIAAKAIQPSGEWMRLALTFTALAGDDSVVLAAPSRNLPWLLAPEPTIQLREGASTRKIEFSDVSRRDGVRIWHLTFNKHGRMLAAHVQITPDLHPQKVNTAEPKWKKLKDVPSPMKKVTPAPVVKH